MLSESSSCDDCAKLEARLRAEEPLIECTGDHLGMKCPHGHFLGIGDVDFVWLGDAKVCLWCRRDRLQRERREQAQREAEAARMSPAKIVLNILLTLLFLAGFFGLAFIIGGRVDDERDRNDPGQCERWVELSDGSGRYCASMLDDFVIGNDDQLVCPPRWGC